MIPAGRFGKGQLNVPLSAPDAPRNSPVLTILFVLAMHQIWMSEVQSPVFRSKSRGPEAPLMLMLPPEPTTSNALLSESPEPRSMGSPETSLPKPCAKSSPVSG